MQSEVERWLRTRADDEGLAIDEDRLKARLQVLFPDSGPLPQPIDLGPQLPQVFSEVVQPAGDGS